MTRVCLSEGSFWRSSCWTVDVALAGNLKYCGETAFSPLSQVEEGVSRSFVCARRVLCCSLLSAQSSLSVRACQLLFILIYHPA